MKGILKPVILLMNRLSYKKKMFLIAAVFFIPLLILGYMATVGYNEGIAFAEKERKGVEYMSPVVKLLQHLQQHRGMSAAYLKGDAAFREKMTQKQQEIGEDIRAIDAIESKLEDALKTKGKWDAVKSSWQGLQGKVATLTPMESFDAHTALIADVVALISHAADNSNLTLDPVLDSFYLMDTIVTKLPPATEFGGQARALGSGVAAAKIMSPDEKARLQYLYAVTKASIDGVIKNMDTALGYNQDVKSSLGTHLKDFDIAFRPYLATMDAKIINANSFEISASDYFNTATNAIDAAYDFYYDIVPVLDGLLKNRIDALLEKRVVAVSLIVGTIAVVLYLFSGFYVAVRESISRIGDAMAHAARGDLSVNVDLQAMDEIGSLGNALNETIGNLKAVISNVSQASNQIASASEELSSTAEQMSRGMQQQTSQTSQIASAMEEMSATVLEVAKNSQSASSSANEASSTAQKGGEVVTRTISGMMSIAATVEQSAKTIGELGKSSDQIGEIVAVIDDIADQTNLLALNAAIEAARAGEQGRGFAVVADEVRKLAERTTKATKEIAQMIKNIQKETGSAVSAMEAGTKEVNEGVQLANQAGESLVQIVTAVQKVNDMIRQIATAAEEQSTAAEEISKSIEEIASVTRETSQGSNQTATASHELSRMATELQRSVGQFKI